MSKLSPRSLRTRLTLWNIAILALILLTLALVLRLVVARSLQDSIDSDLRARAKGAQFYAAKMAQKALEAKKEFAPRKENPKLPPTAEARRKALAPSDWKSRFVEWWFEPDGKRLMGPPEEAPLDPIALQSAARGKELLTTVYLSGEAVRVCSVPLTRADDPNRFYVMQAGYSLTDITRAQANLDRALLLLIPLGLLAAGASGLYLTRRMLRPVQAATREAASIGAEDLGRRLLVEGDDEFSELTATLNGMLARLEASFEQQQRFTADASHELRTPLTVVTSASSRVLSRSDLPQDLRPALERINRASGVMGDIIEDLLLLARSDSNQLDLRPIPLCLPDFLNNVLADIPTEEGSSVENRTPPLTVHGDPRHLSRLFTNLIENAVRYTPPGGTITLDAHTMGGKAIISVTDTGEGISPEHLPHVLERFYRADAARTRASGGTGLGLSICQTIAEAHGGTIQLESKVGQGTRVTVTLPLER